VIRVLYGDARIAAAMRGSQLRDLGDRCSAYWMICLPLSMNPRSKRQHTITQEWNHGLGEIVTALLDAGMQIIGLTEHDSVPWEALPGKMERLSGGEWRLADQPWRLPHSYTLQAVKCGR
jgi:hypothetical protein